MTEQDRDNIRYVNKWIFGVVALFTYPVIIAGAVCLIVKLIDIIR